MSDAVHHPQHYTAYKGLEIIDLTEQMNFNRGNAVKYITRAGLKSSETEIQDLEKAQWYIAREIQRLRGLSPVSTNEDKAQRCLSCGVLWLMDGDKRNVILTDDKLICMPCNVDFSFDQLGFTPPDRTKCPKCKNEWGGHRTSHFVDVAADVITCYSCGAKMSNRKFGPIF